MRALIPAKIIEDTWHLPVISLVLLALLSGALW